MGNFFRAACIGITFCTAAPPAFAELRAEDVWDRIGDYVASLGQEAGGQVERSGNQLIVNGFTITTPGSAAPQDSPLRIDRIVLTERSDGQVSIDLPAIIPMTFSSPEGAADTIRSSVDIRQSGLQILASGTADALRYAYSADDVTLDLTGVEVNGEILPPEENDVAVRLEDLEGTMDALHDPGIRYLQEFSLSKISYAVQSAAPDLGQKFSIDGQSQGVAFSGSTAMPPIVQESADLGALLDAGMETSGVFTSAATAVSMVLETPAGVSEANFLSGAGRVDARMSADGATYAVRQSDLQADLRSDQVALPITFAVEEGALNMTLPLRQSSVPQNFALGLNIAGVSLSDALWGLFDPGAQLPRDPMSVMLDLQGTARLLFDMLGPGPLASGGPVGAPAEIETLDLNQFRISAVGAELTGNGGFTFDNSAEGPKPMGAVDLMLKGGNGLIDTLITAGILPEQQAVGMRMMMGLLAQPAEGSDTMTSRIEVNAEGHVLANGQRIR